MEAPLSKAPPQWFTLINLMWRSVEGIVWKSRQCRDPVPCRWTQGKSARGGRGEAGWVGENSGRDHIKKREEKKNRIKVGCRCDHVHICPNANALPVAITTTRMNRQLNVTPEGLAWAPARPELEWAPLKIQNSASRTSHEVTFVQRRQV